jgi:uncharacterized protein with HEPN domain
MSPDDRLRLRHMVSHRNGAEPHRRTQRADLDTDRMLLFALTRAVEIVGEAASKVD